MSQVSRGAFRKEGMSIKNSFLLSLVLLTAVIAFQNCGSGGFTPISGLQSQSSLILSDGSCVFNNQEVTNGASVTAYQSSTGSSASPCVSQSRTCSSGVLSGTYQYAICGPGAAACLFNGQTIADGASVTAYATASVSSGQTCSSETRTCSNGTLSGSDAYASCSAVPDPTGTWVQACRASSGYSYQQTNIFTASGFQTGVKFYSDGTCSSLLGTANITGTDLVGAAVPSVGANVNKIDLIANTETITPGAGLAAIALNSISFCGISNWAVGVAQSVKGKTCSYDGFSISTNSLYEIMQINGGNMMYLGVPGLPGTSTDASSDANRPTTLDTLPFVKQ